MKIIPPYQITSAILDVINEADDFIVLVSPYVDFNNWERIKIDLLNAGKRGVKIEFYARLENENSKSWEQIEHLGITPKLIKNLHAKLYFNEKSGVVTSMNLNTSSNLKAIEFGAVYDTDQELSELKGFVKKYLEPVIEQSRQSEDDLYIAKEKFHILLSKFLSHVSNRKVNARWRNGGLEFNVNNIYEIYVDKGNNSVHIKGIISGYEFENFEKFKKKYSYHGFQVFATSHSIYISSVFKLRNSNLNFLSVAEKRRLMETTAKFVGDLSEYKNECYLNQRR